MKRLLIKDLMSQLNSEGPTAGQRDPDYLEWISSSLIVFTDEFVRANKLLEGRFIRGMNRTFNTTRFELLLKRWIVEYFEKVLKALDDHKKLTLEDNAINRFVVEKYRFSFGGSPEIDWTPQAALPRRVLNVLMRCAAVICLGLNSGLSIRGKKRKYKVMREALWGLYDMGGYYFHDDFFVDGRDIKKEDLILFSRGVSGGKNRLRGYSDVKRSPYAHFDFQTLSMGIGPFFSRIIPEYIFSAGRILLGEVSSAHFSMYLSIFLYFKYSALPYEKVFSHFEVASVLADNSFTAAHIPESIVCQNYGTKYHFMVYSDLAIKINEYMLSYLACDSYMSWGRAHITGLEGEEKILMLTGFPFKRFIRQVRSDRNKALSDMGVKPAGKIVSFFDESFGGECKMTGENYITFWETALRLAGDQKENTILIKPKELDRYKSLPEDLKRRFIGIKAQMEKTPNVHIIDENKWSFIECIGVSDIVVTQGMTTSSTIAIICGVEGLYLDQARYRHPFSANFKGRLVFNDPEELLAMIGKILKEGQSPLRDIPENLLRDFDAYEDDMGIDRFRDVLLNRRSS